MPRQTPSFLSLIGSLAASRSLRTSFFCALFVWSVWLIATGPGKAIANAIANWEIALTMVFGSMVAGATSMGGGAVAFPVLTKWLQVPAHDAKVFSLAIQSIGMGSASFTIIAMGTPLEWRFIRWSSLGGAIGMILGTAFLAPILPAPAVKMGFTMILTSFGLLVFVLNRAPRMRNLYIPRWSDRERAICLLVGTGGGVITSLMGSGMDIFCYAVMVLLFGLCEKISTPTSVILMAVNSWTGFLLHKYALGNFVAPVSNYWLAAIPVVVVGAPTGALLCSIMQRDTINKILMGLIFIELVSSLILIPLNPMLISFSLFVLILFTAIYYWMYHNTAYTHKRVL